MNTKKLLSLFYRRKKNLPNWKKIPVDRKKTNYKKSFLIATSSGGLLSPLVFESLLGVSLKSRGHDVEFLLCDGVLSACIMCTSNDIDEENYEKNGPKKICNSCFINAYNFLKPTKIKINVLSDYLTNKDKVVIDQLNLVNKTVKELREFSFENNSIGEHAYAGVLRYYGVAELNSNSISKKIFIEYVKSGVKTYLASKKLFKEKKYDEIVLNHGIYIPQGVINLAAKEQKINIINWNAGIRKQSFCLTRGDTYHRSFLHEDNDNWQNISINKQIDERIESYLSERLYGKNDWIFFHKNPSFDPDKLLKEMKVDLNKPIIGMPTNVIWDARINFPANFFENILEWIFYTIDYFSKRNDIQLLIRVHPAEVNSTKPAEQRVKDEIFKKYKSLPKNVFIVDAENNISTYPLFDKCNSVILYATKMGIELPVKNIPVIVCGEAFVRNKKIAIDITSKDHYLNVLNQLPLIDHKVDILRAKKYAYHFFFRRTIKVESIIEVINQWPNIDIDKNLNDILKKKNDPGLEKIIECFENGSDFIFNDEDFLEENTL
tara:strand:- start:1830 stop:3473 length:1644 start_codon:yes stop_codon:yes gene_type:complete